MISSSPKETEIVIETETEMIPEETEPETTEPEETEPETTEPETTAPEETGQPAVDREFFAPLYNGVEIKKGGQTT